MASISDNINKGIAAGWSAVQDIQNLGQALGILEGTQRPKNLATDIVAELRNTGVARSSLGFTDIVCPSILQSTYGNNLLRLLTYRNEGFSTPSVLLSTGEVRRYGIGPTQKMPYGAVYTDVTYSYLLDLQNNVHKFFFDWIRHIVMIDVEAEQGSKPDMGTAKTNRAATGYTVQYRDDYTSTITVTSFNERYLQDGQTAEQVVIQGAYPVFIGDIQYNWGNTDSIIRVPVTYTFFNWRIEDVRFADLPQTAAGQDLNLLQQLLRAGTAIQALSTLRSPQNIRDVTNIINTTNAIIR